MPFIDVSSGTIASDKTDRLDAWVIADSIHGWYSPMNDINDAWRKSSSLTEFSNDHRCTRITLRGLQDDSVPSHGSHGN